jgi:hypothetical protein
MITTKYLKLTVGCRNLPTVKDVLKDYSIKPRDVVTIHSDDFLMLGGCSRVELECDECKTTYTQPLYRLLEDDRRIAYCGSCMHDIGSKNTRETIATQEYRDDHSKRMLKFFATEKGKDCSIRSGKTFSENGSMWNAKGRQTKLERYGNANYNNPKYGSEHPNWNPDKSELQEYKVKVRRVTESNDLRVLPNSDKPRGMCGVDGAYQLDHIIPISYGFDNNIPPEVIGGITNLQFIPWKDNLIKSNMFN